MEEKNWVDLLTECAALELQIDRLRELNGDGSPLRSRQLSLAITKLQEGSHWLTDWISENTEGE